MARLACVDLPEFPLQFLLSRHPEWKQLPSAVVAQDKPQAEILWVSPEARAAGVLPGMRYAQALSLARGLRAAEVPARDIDTEVRELSGLLRRFSPEVEASQEEPGVFWVNAAGLSDLFSSLSEWARYIHGELTERGLRASVVVGFRRFAVYAAARVHEGVLVLATSDEEDSLLRGVPLSVLAINPRLRDTLAKLGIRKVGEFLRLPASTVRRRFGDEARRLYGLASGEGHDLFTPVFPIEPVTCEILLDAPEGNSLRLAFAIRERLHPLLARLAAQGEALKELEISFLLERQGTRIDRIRPADLTLDEELILDLVRLRLEGIPLAASAREISLTAQGAPAQKQQLQLFLKSPRRDLEAADQALARVRAEFGDEAVVRARLTEGHLPEARYAWESVLHLPKARPSMQRNPTLVRRLFSRPACLGTMPQFRLQAQPELRVQGESVSKASAELPVGRVVRSWGPYILSGEWWQGSGERGCPPPIHRQYYFLETARGDVLWVYYDGPRRQWFLQGQVE
jgi:protein ImuB